MGVQTIEQPVSIGCLTIDIGHGQVHAFYFFSYFLRDSCNVPQEWNFSLETQVSLRARSIVMSPSKEVPIKKVLVGWDLLVTKLQ